MEGKKDHCGSVWIIEKPMKINRRFFFFKEIIEIGLGKEKGEGFLRRDVSKTG